MIALAAPLLSQIATGTVVASIRDPGGLAVAGATITLTHSATGRVREASTSQAGDFVIAGLESGAWSVRVTMQGFKQAERSGVNVATGERVSLGDIVLEIGAVSESVAVSAQGATVQTRSAERAEVITPQQVTNLLIRGRNVADLAQLLPGVVVGNPQDELSSTSTIFVQGNRSTTNNIAIDGIPATDMGNGSQLKLTVSQDAVAEVRILVSNYQAEFGRMAGSNVQIVTKSGTREFHGLASYFKRHEQFNANDYFNNINGIGKPRYRYNTWSYNLGGPIYIPGKLNRNRDKLFFNWGQEFWPIARNATGRLTVPTALEKRGDYSQTLDLNNRLIAIRDPVANALFPGNVIPASRLDASGTALLRVFPEPNFSDRGISRGQYNYVFNAPTDAPKYTHSLKVDYTVDSNNTISGSFNAFNEDHRGSVGIPSAGGLNWPLMVKTWYTHPRGYGARYNRIFSPVLLNEFTFGWLTQPANDRYEDSELQKVLRDKIGFVAGQFNPSNNPQNIIPNATFGGVPSPANLVVEGRFPLYNRYHILTWNDNITWTRGAHTWKAGLYAEHYRRTQRTTVAFNGAFDFTRSANNPFDTNWAYSNASLGYFNTYTEVTERLLLKELSTSYEWFVQDNWKITRRLTLDFGVRFYSIPPLYEASDRLAGFVPSRFDPTQRTRLIEPGFNAQRQRVGVHPVTGAFYNAAQIGAIAPNTGIPYNGMVVDSETSDYPRGLMRRLPPRIGPRAGLAWDPFGDGKTAIRTGFGIFFNRFFDGPYFLPFVGQPPIVNTPVLNFGQVSQLRNSAGLIYPANVFAADAQGLLPRVMNFSFSIQRDIGFGTLFDIGYVGSLGRHLYWRRDINPIPMGANFDSRNFDPTQPGRPLPAPFLRPIQGYNNINMIEGGGSSNYHSLQVSAKRRFQRGIEFGISYTWSKAMDFNDADGDNISPLVPRRGWHYGLAGFDRTHVLNVNYIWSLPDKKWSNAAVGSVLNGWQVSGITAMSSGSPLGIGFSTVNAVDITGTPSQGARTDVISNPVLPKGERTFSRNFRTDVFRMPAVGTVGNAGKTLIRGPGINNWDTALFKNFPVTDRLRFQFRWELYNVFNHTQFSALDTTARFDNSTPAVPQINTRFGEFTAARTPRQMQLALRLFF
jgi:hypothetical protein